MAQLRSYIASSNDSIPNIGIELHYTKLHAESRCEYWEIISATMEDVQVPRVPQPSWQERRRCRFMERRRWRLIGSGLAGSVFGGQRQSRKERITDTCWAGRPELDAPAGSSCLRALDRLPGKKSSYLTSLCSGSQIPRHAARKFLHPGEANQVVRPTCETHGPGGKIQAPRSMVHRGPSWAV